MGGIAKCGVTRHAEPWVWSSEPAEEALSIGIVGEGDVASAASWVVHALAA